jgi:hypothetical protein
MQSGNRRKSDLDEPINMLAELFMRLIAHRAVEIFANLGPARLAIDSIGQGR